MRDGDSSRRTKLRLDVGVSDVDMSPQETHSCSHPEVDSERSHSCYLSFSLGLRTLLLSLILRLLLRPRTPGTLSLLSPWSNGNTSQPHIDGRDGL